MNRFEDWLGALEAKGCQPRRIGDGYQARCPALAHLDENPSLTLKKGASVPALVTCHSRGCTFEEIKEGLFGNGVGGGGLVSTKREPDVRAAEPPKPRPLPTGPDVTVYHYRFADGRPAFAVVRRDRPDGKRISQWKPAENNLWLPGSIPAPRPLYHIKDIMGGSDRVAIVEGEKCVEACRKAWPGRTITTWAGGTSAWQLGDWDILAGREVALIADGDEPGHKAMKDLAGHLSHLGCPIALALPEFGTGDVADWLDEDPAMAAARVRDLLHPYMPSIEADNDRPPYDPSKAIEVAGDPTGLCHNQHFRLLGLAGDQVAVRINAGSLLYRSRESLTQPGTLIALAPQVWWVSLTDAQILGSAQARALGDGLIREADQIGQIDLLKIAGRGATRLPDGEVVYHLGDRLLVGGEEQPLEHRDHIWLADAAIPLGEPATDAQMQTAAEAVMKYRWSRPEYGHRMLGWIVAAIVGGALEWRPHIMLNAPASTGKSWMLKQVVARIMGPVLQRIADATPAAIARLTAQSSLPIAIDEAEPSNPWVIELLTMLRIASGAEGMRVRADVGGRGVVIQEPRFSALLSSTATPQLSRADATRLTPVVLGAHVEDWVAVRNGITEAMQHADAIRSRIIRTAPAIVQDAERISETLQAQGRDTREALATAALTAGWRAWGLDTDIVVQAGTNRSTETDAGEALMDVLAIRHRTVGKPDQSVGRLLKAATFNKEVTDLYGIKIDDNGGLLLAPRHRGLMKAMERTRWSGVDFGRLFMQLDSAEATDHPQRFGTVRARAIRVPAQTLQELGIDFSFEPGEDDDGSSSYVPATHVEGVAR